MSDTFGDIDGDTISSYQAGRTFGMLIQRNYPAMSNAQLSEFLKEIHPKYPMLEHPYKQGFINGYKWLEYLKTIDYWKNRSW